MTNDERQSLKKGGIELSQTDQYIFDTFTSEKRIEFEHSTRYSCVLKIGSQSFELKQISILDECRWLRAMVSIAFNQMSSMIVGEEICR